MSSKYELISGDLPAAADTLFEGEGDVGTFSSSEGSGFSEGSPRDEPAIATVSSSFKDSKLCEVSRCDMPNRS